jgi:hypothetical protein
MPLAAAAIMTPEQKASKDKSANLVTMTPTPVINSLPLLQLKPFVTLALTQLTILLLKAYP